MTSYAAEWLLPIANGPMSRASVTLENGRIVAIDDRVVKGAIDLGRAAILPALVNAHTHLELSHLRGAIPRAPTFLDWVRTVIMTRRQYPDPRDRRILDAARAAIAEARASGTGLVGDVSNTLVTASLLRDAGMPSRMFYELLGFNASDPISMSREARAKASEVEGSNGMVRVSLAPHAPYSVSPGLFRAIRADLDANPGGVSSVHLGESPEEVEFLLSGTGPWRTLLETLGVWSDGWEPPRMSPVEYLVRLGFLDRRVLAVHGVQFARVDLERLCSLGVTVVACPRSNRYVGVGAPPIDAFYQTNVGVAFGTDSLASVQDLNLFSELAEARRLAPDVAAGRLLDSATRVGAEALGFGGDVGTIERGKHARLIAVRLPADVSDVEEYLVGGVEPAAIQWLDAA